MDRRRPFSKWSISLRRKRQATIGNHLAKWLPILLVVFVSVKHHFRVASTNFFWSRLSAGGPARLLVCGERAFTRA